MTLKSIQNSISYILLIGTLLSAALVLIGGIAYVIQYGNQNLQFEFLQQETFPVSVLHLWQAAFSLTSMGTIQLGLLLLVVTQIARVLILVFFYLSQRDYWFFAISSFITVVLIYSFFWRV